jgi:monothiol glutaredoxin
MDDAVKQRIQEIVDAHPVVLFMKGTKTFPQCGFSHRAVEVLRRCDAGEFHTVNVLEDPDLRQGIKDFANWPTIPQLYLKGQFIGGSDILLDMFESGELQPLVAQATGKA